MTKLIITLFVISCLIALVPQNIESYEEPIVQTIAIKPIPEASKTPTKRVAHKKVSNVKKPVVTPETSEHINRILEEAIKNNLNLETYIVKPNINEKDKENEKIKKYFSWIEKGTNDLYLIGDKFGNFSKNLPSVQLEDPDNNRSQTFSNKDNE